MAYDLTDLSNYQTYFDQLATKHKLIDSFSYGDQEEQNQEVITWEGTKLWLWPYGPVRIVDNQADNYMQQKEGSLFIGGPEPEEYADRDAYFLQCELIAKGIISRMIKDRYEEVLVTRINGWSFDRAESVLSTKMIGVELKFFFDDPTGFEYDENEWEV